MKPSETPPPPDVELTRGPRISASGEVGENREIARLVHRIRTEAGVDLRSLQKKLEKELGDFMAAEKSKSVAASQGQAGPADMDALVAMAPETERRKVDLLRLLILRFLAIRAMLPMVPSSEQDEVLASHAEQTKRYFPHLDCGATRQHLTLDWLSPGEASKIQILADEQYPARGPVADLPSCLFAPRARFDFQRPEEMEAAVDGVENRDIGSTYFWVVADEMRYLRHLLGEED